MLDSPWRYCEASTTGNRASLSAEQAAIHVNGLGRYCVPCTQAIRHFRSVHSRFTFELDAFNACNQEGINFDSLAHACTQGVMRQSVQAPVGGSGVMSNAHLPLLAQSKRNRNFWTFADTPDVLGLTPLLYLAERD